MAVDHIELLEWMAARERREGRGIDGAQLMIDAGHLAGGDLDPWKALARALDLLKQMNCLLWREASDPGAATLRSPLDQDTARAMSEIRVSATGHTICQAGQNRASPIMIINNSSIGQVGMGDNRVGDIHLVLAQAQQELDRLEVPEDVKEEARSMLERLQGAAASIGTPAAASVLTVALEKALHLQ